MVRKLLMIMLLVFTFAVPSFSATRIQLRRDTAANWTSADPTLAAGEIGYETDTNQFKIGDGGTAWSGLSYFAAGGGAEGESVWEVTGEDDIYYTAGNVGIGNTAPATPLDVTGVITSNTGISIGNGTDQTTALLVADQSVQQVFGWDSANECFSFTSPVCIAGSEQANLGYGLYVNSDSVNTPEGDFEWNSGSVVGFLLASSDEDLFTIGGATNYVSFADGGVVTFEGTADIDLPDDSVDIADISATGTANGGTFLRGDGVWETPGTSANINWDSFPEVTDIEADWNVLVDNEGVDSKINGEDLAALFGIAYGLESGATASVDVDEEGFVAVDTTDDQFVYYGTAKRVIPHERTVCTVVEDLSASDDNLAFYMANDAITVTGVGCNCRGTCSTTATFTLEDRGGNAMTITDTNPTCATTGAATFKAVTSGNALTAGEMVAFDVTNTPTEGDTYALCITYSVDSL